MKFSNKVLSQTISQLCLKKGIVHVVISPGSRNAPLVIGFTEEPSFRNFSIVDERCAAFFALGIAQQLQQPVALVCTSGSALLNYYPALAEAYYSDIPLVVISADRPPKLIDVGDGQTIRQENVFSNHILYSANCKEGIEFQAHNEFEINSALNSALELKGPVHINVPFSEPLYETVNELLVHPNNIPGNVGTKLLSEDLAPFVERWNQSFRKIILIGVLAPNSIEQELLNDLAEDDSVLVLTEVTSNVHHKSFIHAIDQLIAPLVKDEFEALRPDILLTIGGMVVSKKIKAFLRRFPPKDHWHVDAKKAVDTYFSLSHHYKTLPEDFLKIFLPQTKRITSDYSAHWLAIKEYRRERQELYKKNIPFSDFKVFSKVLNDIPNGYQLQLSNSTPVRYAQLFKLDKSLKVFCNRGTSGIDGSSSTAIGAACISPNPTLLITGDLAFLYDSNALWNNYIPKNFKIIVINNGGGGIFRILPGAKETTHFNSYFETQHQYTAEQLCKMYGLNYLSAQEEKSLEKQLISLFENSAFPTLLEIFTPAEINDKVLIEYFSFIM